MRLTASVPAPARPHRRRRRHRCRRRRRRACADSSWCAGCRESSRHSEAAKRKILAAEMVRSWTAAAAAAGRSRAGRPAASASAWKLSRRLASGAPKRPPKTRPASARTRLRRARCPVGRRLRGATWNGDSRLRSDRQLQLRVPEPVVRPKFCFTFFAISVVGEFSHTTPIVCAGPYQLGHVWLVS